MNVAVTIFYAIACAWLVGLTGFAIYKRVKLKKKSKEIKKELDDEQEKEND